MAKVIVAKSKPDNVILHIILVLSVQSLFTTATKRSTIRGKHMSSTPWMNVVMHMVKPGGTKTKQLK